MTTPDAPDSTPRPPAPPGLLDNLVWFVPAVVSALWPLWFVFVYLVVTEFFGLGQFLDSFVSFVPLVLVAMTPGILVGHLLAVPYALTRGRRDWSHKRMAFVEASLFVPTFTLVGLACWQFTLITRW